MDEATSVVPARKLDKNPEEPRPSIELIVEYGDRIVALTPEPVRNFVPSNLKEQQELFLSGEIINPEHSYDKLDAIDFNDWFRQLSELRDAIVSDLALPALQKEGFIESIDYNWRVSEYMKYAHDYNHAQTDEERETIRKLASEKAETVWGKVDPDTYHGLIASEIESLENNDYDDKRSVLLDELKQMVSVGESATRFISSEETVKGLGRALDAVYGSLFDRINRDKEMFDAASIRDVFERILRTEFGAAAAAWEVVLDDASSINVSSAKKQFAFLARGHPSVELS